MKATSRARRWILWGLGGLAVLVLLSVLALPWAARYVVDRVAVLLHDRYDVDFSAGRVEFTLTSLSFTLHDVRLASGAAPNSPIVAATRVSLDLAPAAIRGDLAFDRIELVNPRVSWTVGNGLAATYVSQTPGADSRPAVTVGRLDIVNLDALVTTESSLRLTVRGLSASLRGGGPGRLAGEARIDHGIRLDAEGVAGMIDRVIADVAINGDTLAIRSLVAEAGAGDLHVDGHLTFGEGSGYDLKYRSTIELGELRKWWGRAPPADGRAELSGSIHGALTDPRVTFEVSARDLALGGISEGRVDATGRASMEAIVAETLALRSAEAVFNGHGRVALRHGDESSRIAGEWGLPSLRALSARLDLHPSRLPALPVSGTVNLSWPGPGPAIETLAGDLRATLRQPGTASLTVEGKAGGWTLRYRHALAGETLAELRLTTALHAADLRRSSLRGVVEVRSHDVTALVRQLRESAIPVPAAVDVVSSGGVTATGTVAGSIGAPVVDAAVSAVNVSAGRLDAIQVAGALHADRRQILLTPLTLDIPGAQLELRGSIGFDRAESAGEFDVRIDDPGRLAAMVPADWRPTGSLAARGSWSGPLDRPVVSAQLNGGRLTANGLAFDTVAGDIEMAGDEIRLRDVRLSQPAGDLRVDGRYNIGQRTLSAAVVGRGLHVTLRRLWAPASDDSAVPDLDLESVSVDMRLEGSAERPSGDVSLTAGSVRLSGRDAGSIVARAHAEQGAVRVDVSAPLFSAEAAASVTVESPWPWTASVMLNRTDVVQALTLAGASRETLADSTAALSASVQASGDLDTRSVSTMTMDVGALEGQVRGQPIALVQPGRLSLDGTRVDIEPMHIRLGGLSIRAAGSWGTIGDTPAEGLVVDVDGRVEEVLKSFSAASRDGWNAEGPLQAALKIRGGPSLTTIAGDVFAQVTSIEEKAPEGAATRPRVGRNLSGEVRVVLDLRATALEPNALDGSIVATTAVVSAGQVSAAQRMPTTLRVAKGRILLEQVDWTLPAGAMTASGTVGLGPPHDMDVRVTGTTSLRFMDAFLSGRGDGRATFGIQLAGPIDGVRYEGTVELDDASLVLPEGRVSFAGWSGRLAVSADAVTAEALRGQLNGGEVSLSGSVSRRGAEGAAPLTMTARNVFLEIPRGLRSELDADLTWRNENGQAALSGAATISADVYREPATAMVRMVSALTRASQAEGKALPDWLGATGLDVKLHTNGPLTLENSVGNVEMVPDLRLTGTVADAGLIGSIAIVDDGRIRVSGRSYRLRESAIDFAPDQGLVPRLNVFGETRIGDYEVTLRLSGPADAIETTFSSNPPLSERDLQSLVVTGQTAGLTGESTDTNAFAVGAVSGDVLGLAGQFVGLDSVRVGSGDDLELVSSDVEPSTRLTVSKRFGQKFELVLSENLDDSELTWVIIYRPRPGYEVRLSSSEGEDYTAEFRQEVAFGPGSSLRPTVVRGQKVPDVVAAIAVSGDPGFSTSEVRDVLELREGDRFDFREWSKDRDRIQRLYYDRGYYAVRVTPTRHVGAATSERREVTLDYRIIRGPRTELSVTGYAASRRLLEILKDTWNDVLLPELLAEQLESATRAYLIGDGYLRARVAVTRDSSGSAIQRAQVEVIPGPRTTTRHLTFEGNEAIQTSELQTLASEPALAASLWNDASVLVDEIVAEYASRGYLAATAAVGDVLFEGDRATLPVRISEGSLARVETLQVTGTSAAHHDGAVAALGLAIGSPFAAAAERPARIRLERRYRDLGYRDARVDATSRVSARDGRVDLTFAVTEGPRYVIRDVRVAGAESTSESLVDRAVTLAPGQVAGQADVAETERRLYGLGTFRAAAVRFEPVPSASSGETTAVDAVVDVQETRRYLLRYGVALSSEYETVIDEDVRSVGVAADLRDRNFLGRGIALALGAHVERNLASVRGLFSMPRLGSLPVRTNVSLTARGESQTGSTGTLYSDEETNLVFEQRWRPRGWLELAWGYGASRRRVSFELQESPERPVSFDGLVASMNATAVLDRRNSVFDPTRGWFHSASVQWGLRELGSDFDYLRTLIRGSYYQPIGPLVLASNVRWGHLEPLGGIPPLTVFDLFFKAGGTQTVRGYKQDELSRYEALGIPLGGTRLVVFNEEIRFPIFRIVKGVAFADAGNTFAESFSLSDLELGVGFGLRITTPLAPIRIDLGYPMPRRPGAGGPRWHFSIGQMF